MSDNCIEIGRLGHRVDKWIRWIKSETDVKLWVLKSNVWKKYNFSLNFWIQPCHVQKFVFLITLFIKFRYSVYISQCVQCTMCTFHRYFLQQNQSWYQSSLVQFSLLKGMQNYTSVICSVFKFCTMYRFLPSESLSAVCPKTDAPLTFHNFHNY